MNRKRLWHQLYEEYYLLVGIPMTYAQRDQELSKTELKVFDTEQRHADSISIYLQQKRNWKEIQIDTSRLKLLGRWILDNLPTVERRTGFSGICVSYSGAIPFWSNGTPEATIFLDTDISMAPTPTRKGLWIIDPSSMTHHSTEGHY